MTFNRTALDNQLMVDEGLRLTAYKDSRGILTIGVGHNLDAKPLTPAQVVYCGSDGRTAPISHSGAIQLLHDDEDEACAKLDAHCAWWQDLDDVRARAMIDLMFNMGWGTLQQFHHFLSDMQAGLYSNAAADLEASMWYKEVGNRGPRVVGMVRTGQDSFA